MSNRYITKQIRLACLSGQPFVAKDIWQRLEQTIAVRKILVVKWEECLQQEALLDLCYSYVENPVHAFSEISMFD